MNPYVLIILADIFMAVTFVFQKKYQKISGTSFKAGVIYNALLGCFSATVFLIMNKFDIKISLFSFVMAAIFAIVITLYIIIGFKVMEKENMSVYTLFLMSGGMTVPYIWGVLFLNEELTVLRTIGLLLIITAIIISNSGAGRLGKKQLLMCVAIFFLNGISSVVSKMHQINPVSKIVSSSDFAFLAMMFKAIFCLVAMIVFRKRIADDKQSSVPIKKVIPVIFLASLADGVSFMLQLIGATRLPATVLYPFVTGGAIVLTSIAGILVFKEKLSIKQWIGIVICFSGTLLFL